MTLFDPSIGWTVHTKTNGKILSNFTISEIQDINQLTRGETARYELHFPQDDLVVSSTYTVESGTIEQYDHITVESGATLTINGELYANTLDNQGTVDDNNQLTLYGGVLTQLSDYADFAGGYDTLTMEDSTVKYREFIPDDAEVNSLLLGFEPGNGLQDRDIPGVWGLVSRGSDTRPMALSDQRYRIEVEVLAEYPEYADHTEVENDLLV